MYIYNDTRGSGGSPVGLPRQRPRRLRSPAEDARSLRSSSPRQFPPPRPARPTRTGAGIWPRMQQLVVYL